MLTSDRCLETAMSRTLLLALLLGACVLPGLGCAFGLEGKSTGSPIAPYGGDASEPDGPCIDFEANCTYDPSGKCIVKVCSG